ncbi:MAG: hypothetical protein ACXWEJ_10145 [Actinomycetota bacterium]
MKTRLAVLLVAVVAASSLSFTGVATAGTAAKTIVTIKGPDGDFHGKVKSQDPGCRGDRLVRLFKSDSADGPFERTGNSDTSEQQGGVGVWSLGNTGLRDGFFYAKAKATPDCKGGRSGVLELVHGVPQ